MNTYTRFLREEEAHSIFETYLTQHFPADEVKPWKSIARMWADGCYFAVGVFEDCGDAPAEASNDLSDSVESVDSDLSQLRGYAFFVESPDTDACLLDYYAILPAFRSAGLGGHTLQRLADQVRSKNKYLLIETEDIDFAETEEEITERTRRDAFYTGNGCVKTDTKGSVYGVRYAVWTLGLPEATGPASPFGSALSDAALTKVCEDMNTLYRLMVPGDKFDRFITIQRS